MPPYFDILKKFCYNIYEIKEGEKIQWNIIKIL